MSRTGWSCELGYEIFLQDGSLGDILWEKIMAVGTPLGLKPGHTSSIRRIEGGMLSYQADADINTNPYELGMERLINLDMEAEFIGKDALLKIRNKGVNRKQVGLRIECDPLKEPNNSFWEITKKGQPVGKVTSAVYSPRLKQNIALAFVIIEFSEIGSLVEVSIPSGISKACIVEIPFFDPEKKIIAS